MMRSLFRSVPGLPRALLLGIVLAIGGCGGGGGDGKQAHIRLLNASTGYDSLDLYSNRDSSSDDSDSLQLSAVTFGTVSSYANLDSDTYSLKLKRAGVTSTLYTASSQKLTDDSHTTYLAYGSSGHFSALAIADDQDAADTSKAKVAVYNVTEAGGIDVYVTDEAASLEDASPQFSAVSSGAGTSSVVIDSGTYRLRVTGTGDTSDLRLDLSNVVFDSKQVVSLIFTGTSGGVLVNAMFLPQQGSITKYTNTKARVRGAVGIANGTSVIEKIGGVSLLSNAAAGVIGSKYEQVDAGTLSMVLSVDGTQVSVPDQTLTAGGDYTLLVWSDASGSTQTSLIVDDNHIPATAGKVKIRLMNGMSGLAAPITLAVDYSPIAEGIEVGTASAPTELEGGTDFQLDVSNTTTAQPVRSQSGVTLQAGSVYTMFLSGGGATAATSTVRKDR